MSRIFSAGNRGNAKHFGTHRDSVLSLAEAMRVPA